MCIQAIQAEIVSLCADIHRAEYRLLALIEELDAAKSWRHEAMPSCAHWLNAHCGLDLVTAREKVRIAHALPKLPLIRAAFRSGELSYSKVRAITRVADWENEAELVAMATANTAAHVARIVTGLRQVERLKEAKVAFDAYRHRSFTCRFDENGSLVFEGRLPAEQGALLLQALDRAMDWLFTGQPHRGRQQRDDARVEDHAARGSSRRCARDSRRTISLGTAECRGRHQHRRPLSAHRARSRGSVDRVRRSRCGRCAADRERSGASDRNGPPDRLRQRRWSGFSRAAAANRSMSAAKRG